MAKILVLNWKMFLLSSEANNAASAIAQLVEKGDNLTICPSYIHLTLISKYKEYFTIAAQDCSSHQNGPHTGDISAEMLRDIGCVYVLIGHSERRQQCNESSKMLENKIQRALESDLKIIYCIGENLNQRKEGNYIEFLERQIDNDLIKNNYDKIMIAYEPIWAIGSGLIPQNEEICEVISAIKSKIHPQIKVLYGGSVNANNIKHLCSIKDLAGFLVGSVGTKPEGVKKMLEICREKLV